MEALLSIGGWTGSIYYSTAVGNAENRTAFVKAVVGMVQKYNLDGIDFEYISFCITLLTSINLISSHHLVQLGISWEAGYRL